MTNILIIRNRLAALAQRIKSSQILKIDSKNKFESDRDLNFKSCSKSTEQRYCQNNTTLN